jgi:hypothetical protein
MRIDRVQGLPHAVARDTSADRVYLGGQSENFLAYVLSDELSPQRFLGIHGVVWDYGTVSNENPSERARSVIGAISV